VRGLIAIELLDFAAREWPPAVAAPRWSALAECTDAELEQLVVRIARHSGLRRDAILRRFGRHLFARFAALFPAFQAGDSALDLLAHLEARIHDELRALPAGLDPARIACVGRGRDWVELRYQSERGLEDLAEGLLHGCADHFGERVEVLRKVSAGSVWFRVQRVAERDRCGRDARDRRGLRALRLDVRRGRAERRSPAR
jgi:hypothetical protein